MERLRGLIPELKRSFSDSLCAVSHLMISGMDLPIDEVLA